MDNPELLRLQALEDENRLLKRVVADQALNIQVLKEMNKDSRAGGQGLSDSPFRSQPGQALQPLPG